MTAPMLPQRLAEIRHAAMRWDPGTLALPSTTNVFRHRAELLTEVDRLTEALAAMEAERGLADNRLLAEHYRLQARASEARALADVAAKRQLLRVHTGDHVCAGWRGESLFDDGDPCLTLALLAAPDAAHPDYDARWTVTAPQ